MCDYSLHNVRTRPVKVSGGAIRTSRSWICRRVSPAFRNKLLISMRFSCAYRQASRVIAPPAVGEISNSLALESRNCVSPC
jgi:hypothetical protein